MDRHHDYSIIIGTDGVSLENAIKLGNVGDMADVCPATDGASMRRNRCDISFRAATHVSTSTDVVWIEIPESARAVISETRGAVDGLQESGMVVYGVNTGFGSMATQVVSDDETTQLQLNLIRSHACGSGQPIHPGLARRTLALRIASLVVGKSGIRMETLDRMVAIYNAGCVPMIPEQGTVGASGDLAPLAHMTLALMGEGMMWNSHTRAWDDASTVLKNKGLKPIALTSKEGLALTNGTSFMLAHICAALWGAMRVFESAIVTTAIAAEALAATHAFADERIHMGRAHPGQIEVARKLRALFGDASGHPGQGALCSAITPQKVQDGYSLRCVPQILGPVYETLQEVRRVVEIELRSVTDNPLVFTTAPGCADFVSGGNFHGQPLSCAADKLAMAMQYVATHGERLLYRLVSAGLSKIHPSFLTQNPGLSSGFMIDQYLAAAITSENKVLCHPASVDTIPTCEGCEDHVSMGGFAVRKACQVVDNVSVVIGAELFGAHQALCLLHEKYKLKASEQIEKINADISMFVPQIKEDVQMKQYVDICTWFVSHAMFVDVDRME